MYTRLGLGIVDGRFSVLALSPKREVIAAAPVVTKPGSHYTQMNGLAHIRAALRLLFSDGISALFPANTCVETYAGNMTIVNKDLYTRYQEDYTVQKVFSMSNGPIPPMSLATVDVMNGAYIRTLSTQRRDPQYEFLTAKFSEPNTF